MAFTIEQVQRPALVIAHNKTLAAQLCNEFRELFPDNSVEYFVSYYDYYQPEAYVPAQDLYIEKDSSINEEIERLRHAATASLFGRRDVIVVASVSCIFGLGSPEKYDRMMLLLKKGEMVDRDAVLRKLVDIQYSRNDKALGRGTLPRARRDARGLPGLRRDRLPRGLLRRRDRGDPALRPAHRRGAAGARARRHLAGHALRRPTSETIERARRRDPRRAGGALRRSSRSEGKLLESHRLRQRTQFDMEMLRELGFCNGIENYSRILDGRQPGERPVLPARLLPGRLRLLHRRVAPDGAADRRHVRGRPLAQADAGGLRLPAAERARQPAADLRRVPPASRRRSCSSRPRRATSSATTRRGSSSRSCARPASSTPRSTCARRKNQIDDLMNEIRKRVEVEERTLVTTLTKKMSEDLTDYLLEYGFRVRYLHSEIDTLERIQIIRELRLGEYDVLVGVNLLREGLDLPEVSLVAILDADKEGFLRGETSLIQTIGRAARNIRGKVIMYADKETRRCAARSARPTAAARSRSPTTRSTASRRRRSRRASPTSRTSCMVESKVPAGRGRKRAPRRRACRPRRCGATMVELEEEMLAAADDLRFEYAAKLRDEIKALRRELDEAEAERLKRLSRRSANPWLGWVGVGRRDVARLALSGSRRCAALRARSCAGRRAPRAAPGSRQASKLPDGAQRLTYRHRPAHDHARTEPDRLHGDQEKPQVDGYITRIRPDLIYANGKVPRVDILHLHHGVWVNLGAQGRDVGGLPAERFFAAGEEKTIFTIPKGYGYAYKASSVWVLNHMIHNLITDAGAGLPDLHDRLHPGDVARRRRASGRSRPIWMDVQNGKLYPVFDVRKGAGTNGRYTYPTQAPRRPTAAARARTSGSSTATACSSPPPATCIPAACTPTSG